MWPAGVDVARWIAGRAPRAQRERLEGLAFRNAGHGYDAFGLHPKWVAMAAALARPLHDRWFRATAHDAHHLPASGAAILVANHAGMLPFDAAMLWVDVLRHGDRPRVARPVADHFVSSLPFFSTLFARVGMVGGSRENARALLEAGELLLVFPEGTAGIGKPWRERYRLQRWRVGHAELAIRHGAPVIPIAIIGSEEQWPQVAKLPLHPFGAPWLPVPATPFPLPVHYHLWYGAPIALHERFAPDEADDPATASQAAAETKAAVQALIDRGLRERPGIFR